MLALLLLLLKKPCDTVMLLARPALFQTTRLCALDFPFAKDAKNDPASREGLGSGVRGASAFLFLFAGHSFVHPLMYL